MKKKSYAKINLTLDVIEKRQDSYHNIDGVMQLINLYDVLDVEFSEKFIITSNSREIPLDEKNLVYKAFTIMKEQFKFKENFSVYIEKNIPVSAGIAGGSTNAACFINIVSDMLNLNLSLDEKRKIARKVGADVPYLLCGGTARTRGIGDELEILENIPKLKLLIVNNGIEISTPYVYKNIIPSGQNNRVDLLIESYNSKDMDVFFDRMFNSMEVVSINYCNEIKEIKDKMKEFGCKKALMSGSGPTVFGIFLEDKDLERAYNYFKNKYEKTFKTTTIGEQYGQ